MSKNLRKYADPRITMTMRYLHSRKQPSRGSQEQRPTRLMCQATGLYLAMIDRLVFFSYTIFFERISGNGISAKIQGSVVIRSGVSTRDDGKWI